MLTLKKAAEETGKTKPTILKQIQKGRIRAEKNIKEEWEIDPASLFKIYPAVSSESGQEKRYEVIGNSELIVQNKVLNKEVELLKDKLRMQEVIIANLESDKVFLQEQLKSSTLLLEHRATKKPFWKVF